MAEDLIARYQLDISDLKLKVNQLEGEYKKLTEAQKQSEKAGTDSAKKVADENDKASKKVNETTKATSLFDEQVKTLGNTLVSAFAVERIIAFGKEAIKAFAEAEQNAKLLQTAVSVNGGVQADFENLINQSSRLQETTIFSDDDIQRAQTAALQYGLTAQQVEELIPVLADFASATGQDLNSALSAVISGTEGSERALRAYGIQVDSSIPKAENYSKIIQQLTNNFEGQSEVVAGTATGAIKQYDNQLGELAENIGSKIYPIWQTFATGVLAFSRDLIDAVSGNLGVDATKDAIARLDRDRQIYSGLAKKASLEQINTILLQLPAQRKVEEEKLKGLKKGTDEYINQQNEVDRLIQKEKIYTAEVINRANAQVPVIKLESVAYKDLIKQREELKNKQDFNSRSQLEAIEKEIKKREEAGAKARESAQKVYDEQKRNLESLKQITEKSLQDNLNATAKNEVEKLKIQRESVIKQAEEFFKGAGGEKNKEAVKAFNEARLAIDQQYNELIKQARIKSAQDTYNQLVKLNQDNLQTDLKNTLENIDANANAEILARKQAVLAKGDFSKEAEKKLQDDILKITLDAERKKVEETFKFENQKNENARKLAVQNAVQQVALTTGLNGLQLLQSKELADKLKTINATYNDQKFENDQQYANELAKLGIKIVDGQLKFTEVDKRNWIEKNEEKIKAVQQLASELFNFYSQILDAQIKSKEDELNNLKETFEAEDEELQLQYEKRLIGAGDFEKEQNRIKQQRIDSEKKIQAEIIKLKRQEDIANKAKAIFDIGINTAVQISKVLANPFLVALIATLGAVQIASVLATPLPKYAKGTKYLKRGNNPSGVDTIPIMADEGERIIPRKNNLKYWDIYNALDENKWNEFVQAKYIYPALKNQIKEFKKAENKTFAENISNSFELNHDLLAQKIGAEIEWRNRKGIKVQGMNELIEVMDKQIDFRKI